MAACSYLHRSGFIYSRRHTAGCKAFPNQLVQAEQVSLKRFFYNGGSQCYVRGTDGLMGVLYLNALLLGLASLSNIVLAVMLFYKCPGCCVGFVCDSGGIRTQVGDKTQGPLAFYLHAFIELLGQTHGLLGGKVKYLGGFLLQGTGCKWDRCLLYPLPSLYFLHLVAASLQLAQNLVQFLLVTDDCLAALGIPGPIILCNQGLLTSLHEKVCLQIPVFLRNECIDFILTVANHAKGNRLHAACA